MKGGPMGVGIKYKELCSHVNAIQKTSTTEDELSNQVDRVTMLADINQTLSLATLVLAQIAHKQSRRG